MVIKKRVGIKKRLILNPSELMNLKAVKKHGYVIKNIKNPSERVQLEAVKRNGLAIKYIKNPTEKVKLEAVKEDKAIICYLKNPSERIQLEAVKQKGQLIQCIKNPSERVCREAIKQNPRAIDNIENRAMRNKLLMSIKKVKPKINKFFEAYKIKNYKKTIEGRFKTLENAKTFIQDKYGHSRHPDDPDTAEIWIILPNGKEIFFEGGYYGDEWITQKEWEYR